MLAVPTAEKDMNIGERKGEGDEETDKGYIHEEYHI
jgi:hypothetical protein